METYLIWSNEHKAWWKAGRNGYATGLAGAGQFARDEAIQLCREALLTAPDIGMIAELPVRLTDITAMMRDQAVPDAVHAGRCPWTNED